MSRTASEIAAEQIANIPDKEREIREMVRFVDEAVTILHSLQWADQFGKLLHETWLLKKRFRARLQTLLSIRYTKRREVQALLAASCWARVAEVLCSFCEAGKSSSYQAAPRKFLHVPFEFETSGSQIIYHAN